MWYARMVGCAGTQTHKFQVPAPRIRVASMAAPATATAYSLSLQCARMFSQARSRKNMYSTKLLAFRAQLLCRIVLAQGHHINAVNPIHM